MTRVLDPQRYSPGPVIAASTALLTLMSVLGGLLLANKVDPPFLALDNGWHQFVETLRSPAWDGINGFLNLAGYRGIYVLHACLIIILLVRRRPQAAVFSVVAAASVALLTQLIKAAVGRGRPSNTIVLTDTGSFPSGHVSATAAFLLVVSLLIGRLWIWLLAVLGTLIMMVSRTYLSAHWLMDTLGGALLAAAVVPLVWLMFQGVCVRENTDARRLLTWRARASRRQRAARQPGSERG